MSCVAKAADDGFGAVRQRDRLDLVTRDHQSSRRPIRNPHDARNHVALYLLENAGASCLSDDQPDLLISHALIRGTGLAEQ